MPNWGEVLNQIKRYQANALNAANTAQDVVRREYLMQLHKHTGRNVIAYYSGFLSKPGVMHTDITDDDKNGFMMAVHGLDRSKGLDLFLHTPGGSIAAAESIVHYLRKMFNDDIRAIVPQIAMSAGTMIACCCKSIVMGNHSNLGPIDPQLFGLPAHGVQREFREALAEIKKDADAVKVWHPALSR